MQYEFPYLTAPAQQKEKIIGCVSRSPSPPRSPISPALPLLCCGMCQHLSWQKAGLALTAGGSSSVFVTDSAFTRPPLLPALHTSERNTWCCWCALGRLQRGIPAQHCVAAQRAQSSCSYMPSSCKQCMCEHGQHGRCHQPWDNKGPLPFSLALVCVFSCQVNKCFAGTGGDLGHSLCLDG